MSLPLLMMAMIRWWAQGPTRRHFGCLKSIAESLRNNLLSSSDPHQVTLFLTYFLTCYLAFAFYLIYFLEFFLAFYLVYLRGFFVNEVRWATLWSWISICFFLFLLLLPLLPVELFSQSVLAENRQIDVLLKLSEAQTHGIYEVFASGDKNRGNYSVFWPVPSKNTGIYAVFSMLQEVSFPCQRHKNTVN